MAIQYLEKSADTLSVTQALRQDGAVVVKDVADHDLIDRIVSELRPRLDMQKPEEATDQDKDQKPAIAAQEASPGAGRGSLMQRIAGLTKG